MDKVTQAVIIDRRSPSSTFSATVMRRNVGKEKILIVSEDLNNVSTLESVPVNGEHETTVVPLNFPDIPSDAVIMSIHSVNLSATETDDFAVGLTYVTGNEDDKNREKYFNIYSGCPGSSLNVILRNYCKTLKLDFFPYLLKHAVYMSGTLKKGIWLLSGSDKRIHAYEDDGQQQIYERNIEEYFIEFKDTKESCCLAFDTKAFSNYKKRISFYGSASRKSVLSIVDSEKNQILHTFVERYSSLITTVQLFNVSNRTMKTNEFKSGCIPDYHSVDENQQVCLLVGSMECTVVYMNVLEKLCIKPITLVEIGRGQSVMTSLVSDINFDSKNEIILGTMENHILSFEFKDNTWIELQSLDLRHQVYTISYVDLTGEGVKDVVVMTKKGIHILKHEPEDIMELVQTHHRLYRGLKNQGFFSRTATHQKKNLGMYK